MSKGIWGGFAIGAVIGGGLGDDEPSGDSSGGLGGAKNTNNDSDSDNGGQGLFSLWGREIWLYIGGIVGVGNTAGIYLTTGPMIGKNPDWAIGAGVHIAKSFGLGVVVPIRQALQSYNKHQDKAAAYIDMGQRFVENTFYQANNFLNHSPEFIQGLERVVNTISS